MKKGEERIEVVMSKLEKKFGRFAIKNLSLYLIICYAFGYLMTLINSDFMMYLTLDPYKIIMQGQIWRLVTWILVPPGKISFWIIITLYFYYSLGTSLERTWGTYRYNVYMFTGFICIIVGSFLYVAISVLQHYPMLQGTTDIKAALQYLCAGYSTLASLQFTTYYVNMSILLAFACTFPDMQVLLMFVIPIKMKWIGIAYGVFLGYELVVNILAGAYPTVVMIVMSLLNFIIFFFTSRKKVRITRKQMKQRVVYRAKVNRANANTRHKCAICGRTEADGENLEFRYCSKCEGNYEYCQDHLFTHTHVK